jgi:hypothetical protein
MPLPRIIEPGRPGRGIIAPLPFNGLVFGDSLVPGIGTRLAALRPGSTWNEVSIGTLGLTTTGGSGSGAITRFSGEGHTPYYQSGYRNVVVFLSILHHDVQDTSATTAQIFDNYEILIANAQGLGWQVCAVTVPATVEYNDPGGSPYKRPERIALNDLLRNGGSGQPIRAGAHYLANTDGIAGFDQDDVGTSGSGAPYLIDGIHFSDAGKDVVAPCIHAQIP